MLAGRCMSDRVALGRCLVRPVTARGAPPWFSETAGFTSSPVVDRARLRWGNVVPGPAVIEELDATTLVHPGYQATVDQYGNLLLHRG